MKSASVGKQPGGQTAQLKLDTMAGGLADLETACVPSCRLNVGFSLDLSASSLGEGLHHCVQTYLTISITVLKHRDHKKPREKCLSRFTTLRSYSNTEGHQSNNSNRPGTRRPEQRQRP